MDKAAGKNKLEIRRPTGAPMIFRNKWRHPKRNIIA